MRLMPAFAAAMAALGPFETAPRLALAVSGGPDSMALALLADVWTRQRGGTVVALIVDHRLREGSGLEARTVAGRLAGRGIEAHVLPLDWPHGPPSSAIQERARLARHRVLQAWCRAQGVLHLVLGHHRDDQAETVRLRRAAGSGPDGLAAMASLARVAAVQVLRPLLDIPKAALLDFLAEQGQPFVEDPSNRDPRFARTHLREAVDTAGDDPVAQAAARGAQRRAAETALARLAAEAVRLDPLGFATLEAAPLMAADDALRCRMLSRLAGCLGGRAYAPRRAGVARLAAALAAGRGATLGGCRFLWRRGRLVVLREGRNLPAPRLVNAGECVDGWDGRFRLRFDGVTGAQAILAPLGKAVPTVPVVPGAPAAPATPAARDGSVPGAVHAALPALWDAAGPYAVPGLCYRRDVVGGIGLDCVEAGFRPRMTLAGTAPSLG